jgi:hypothetical protein
MVAQDAFQALARAFAPGRQHHPLALPAQAFRMLAHRLVDIDARLALGGEIAALPAAGRDDAGSAPLGHFERRHEENRPRIEARCPFLRCRIE